MNYNYPYNAGLLCKIKFIDWSAREHAQRARGIIQIKISNYGVLSVIYLSIHYFK